MSSLIIIIANHPEKKYGWWGWRQEGRVAWWLFPFGGRGGKLVCLVGGGR